jgi:hypothetical protein
MGLLSKLTTGGFIAGGLWQGPAGYRRTGKLVTFRGWRGQWWKRIKPGRAAVDAVTTVGPAKVWIPVMLAEEGLRRFRRRR